MGKKVTVSLGARRTAQCSLSCEATACLHLSTSVPGIQTCTRERFLNFLTQTAPAVVIACPGHFEQQGPASPCLPVRLNTLSMGLAVENPDHPVWGVLELIFATRLWLEGPRLDDLDHA